MELPSLCQVINVLAGAAQNFSGLRRCDHPVNHKVLEVSGG
jgi:UDP-3-O-acyl-N-acetylglucosamine deacetylase